MRHTLNARDRANPRRPGRFRPVVECLEDRTLLSICTVDRLTDLGQGQGMAGDLRYCITQAQNGDSITFSARGTINLTRALPNLTRSVSIEGPGAGSMTVLGSWAGGEDRVFTVASGVTASVSGLTISNGGNGGGGIYNSGTLTINNTTISGNTVTGGIANLGILTVNNSTISGNYWGGDNVRGAGIANWGTLTVNNSTISGNWVNGGAAAGGGGIWSGGTLTVNNSTISGNRVTGVVLSGAAVGGGIWSTAGTVTVSNSTIAGNSATDSPGSRGGGILAVGAIATRNTIIAGNTAPAGPDVSGNLGSLGYNLIGNSQGASGFHPADLPDVNPRLGPLRDNGGPTRTHAFGEGSPAVNGGDPAFRPPPVTDQRGLPRVFGSRIDIGAYEAQFGPLASYYVYPDIATVSADEPVDLAVLALDVSFNLVTNYTGEILIVTTDQQATSPAPYRFRPDDGGIAFPGSVTFRTPGLQVLLVLDTATYTVFGVAVFDVLAPSPGRGLDPAGLRDSHPDANPATATHRPESTPQRQGAPPVELERVSVAREVVPPETGRRLPRLDPSAFASDVLDQLFAALA